MTPTEYEHHVTAVLQAEGWDATVTPARRDFGLDIVGKRKGQTLGVQVKMYGTGRAVNAQIVMQLFGAAKYQDCTDVMLVTNGRVLDEAEHVANKLGIVIRQIPTPDQGPTTRQSIDDTIDEDGWTFDRVWKERVTALVGQKLTRANGAANEIISVDWGGLNRRTSSGAVQSIDVEVFRWVIDRLLAGQIVLREEINDQYPKRASSGVVLILGSLDLFETVKVGSKSGLRFIEVR